MGRKSMKFDPLKKRRIAEEFELDWVLATTFEADMPMGNVMVSHLDSVIALTLVGFGAAVAPILPTFSAWLKTAITEKEKFGDSLHFHHKNLCWALAMYAWIAEAAPAADTWEQARLFDAGAAEEGIYSRKELASDRLDDYMAFCLQAGRYAEGIAAFEQYATKPKRSLAGSVQPRAYAYQLCLAQIGPGADAVGIEEAGHAMLRANLEEWLSYGAYTRAATWLKIVHWDHGARTTPAEAILRAYDDMPTIPRPPFV
jgi:hypothetical protein